MTTISWVNQHLKKTSKFNTFQVTEKENNLGSFNDHGQNQKKETDAADAAVF